jgi:anti-sigma factor RsiW
MDTDPIAELPADVKQHMTRYKAPPGLERRIRHMIAQESRRPGWLERLRGTFARGWPMAASFACGLLVALSATTLLGTARNQDDIDQQLLSAHIRSLMPNHLMDVASTDQHTVKPWFNGKLDFSPPVYDFAGRGYPLVGGRLDYVDGRPVAALVYGRRRHLINVFLWPTPSGRVGERTTLTRQGYHLLHWTTPEYRYWVVSDLGLPELNQFVDLLRQADSASAQSSP